MKFKAYTKATLQEEYPNLYRLMEEVALEDGTIRMKDEISLPDSFVGMRVLEGRAKELNNDPGIYLMIECDNDTREAWLSHAPEFCSVDEFLGNCWDGDTWDIYEGIDITCQS